MRLRLQLTSRITLVFMLFAALLLLAVGASIYLIGRDALQRAATAELLAAAQEKEAGLNAWIDDNQSRLSVVALTLERSDGRLDPTSAAHYQALAELSNWVDAGGFPELLLLEPGTGKVVVDTDPVEVGKLKEDMAFFINGQTGPFVQPPFYSLDLQAPAMMVSQPLQAADGKLQAVLAGRLDLSILSTIMGRRTGVHETDAAYLVNSSNLFVTQPRFISDPAVLQRGNFAQLVNRCLRGESGTVSEADFRGLPVLAVYRWLPARQLCLVVQIDQAEAFAPIQAFGLTLLVISGIGLLAGLALAIALARTITSPIRALQQGAQRFGRGELDARMPETSADELGALAREFNTMASSLADQDASLRANASELAAANTQQVLEIAERKLAGLASQRRNMELAALNQMGQALNKLADPAEVLELIYGVIGRVVDTRNLYIALYDAAAKTISFPVYTIDGQRITRPARVLANGLTECIIRTKKPVFLPRDLTDGARTLGVEPQGRQAQCYLGVPMLAGDEAIGVIAVQDYEHEDVYDLAQMELLGTIAAQASIALENARLFAETQRLARTDALVGIANRRYLLEVGARELSRARRFGHPLSVLMLDIDHFKSVNDIYGHAAGDQILKIVARALVALVRDIDIVARYGGEEFVVLLLETDLAGACITAERLRQAVAQTVAITDQGPLRVTLSIGATCTRAESEELASLLARADSALYAAKQAGRNRVEAG